MAGHYIEEANLPLAFFEMSSKFAEKTLLVDKRDDVWVKQSYAQIADKVKALSAILHDMGAKQGDHIVICGENRSEWAIADLAVMAIGCVSVPAYTSNTIDDHHYIVTHSASSFVFCSGGIIGQKMLSALSNIKQNIPFICFDALATLDDDKLVKRYKQGCFELETLLDNAPVFDGFDKALRNQNSDDVCCIIYTSGTGGRPKGVKLTHRSIQSNIKAAIELLDEGDATTDAVFLSLLPLSHSYEHTAGMHLPFQIAAEVWYCEGADKISANLAEVKPTLMTAVPRLYEVLHDRIVKGVKAKGGLSEKLFFTAVRLGRKKAENMPLSVGETLLNRLVEKLVRGKVRGRLGGRLKFFVSGGAPLNPDIGYFFLGLGVNILQGYGQTEASPLISANRPNQIRIDTVGPVVGGVEVKLAEDGELLARGDCIMAGYWQDDKATAATIKDGWLYTGDLAEISDDGFITISGRKKDIIVNSGGDNIAPSRVEAFLCIEPEIEQVMVTGDKRPYLSAIIVPADGDGGASESQIKAAIDRANLRLSQIEQVRKFIIADAPFTVDNGQMTPTLKVRRHIVQDVYANKIDNLYKR